MRSYVINSSYVLEKMIKSRSTRWAKLVERMGERRNAYRTLVGKPE
jgi:hypothetical protein